MSTALLRALGVAVAIGGGVLLVAGSHTRVASMGTDRAIIRLAWGARPERIELCRRVPQEELDQLPVHMRRAQVCEGAAARYELVMEREGVPLSSSVLRGGGMRNDRQIYVFREIPVPPGPARISVRFSRLDSTSIRPDSGSARAEPQGEQDAEPESDVDADSTTRRRRAVAIPPRLSLDTVIALRSRSVLLITYDATTRRLVARTGEP